MANTDAVPVFWRDQDDVLERPAHTWSRTECRQKKNTAGKFENHGKTFRLFEKRCWSWSQQRVAIARALVHDPKLIVCDEPTSNLDHEAGRSVMNILRGVAKSPDRALIVVTHDPRIFEFADRIAHMDDGKIIEVVEGKNKERLQ